IDGVSMKFNLGKDKVNTLKEFLIKKIQEHGGNISKTAEAIGLERSYLHRKIKAYGIEVSL
ncbi:MAG: hypothetical protein K2P92_06040, partial [Bdellovibrionaceae bacterium]|nr:hypothetical protein [Pseudobdellovibrionaceae bacterium]